ncbi:CPBP family intramembrane glutamic endopeptidase [Nakamurella sp.]|uniref:CPBP family intramembrane glutamic endopeptidase n=1 Tax=Nakamurella sp. TaxID=1869182 RepID=UPI003782EA8B
MNASAEAATPQAPQAIRSAASWLRFGLGFTVLLGVLLGTAELDPTGRYGLVILAAVLVTALVVERFLYRLPPRKALRRLGFARPTGRSVLTAGVVGGLVLLVYPLATAVTGTSVQLRPDWPWLLVGIFAFHGLAEETVWRGYAYRRLRAGRSFGAAVLWTMPLVAVAHLPIFITSGPVVGSATLLVAAVTSLPFAHLFDMGRGTIWAPAILHTAIDSFKLVIVPAVAVTTFSLLLAAVSIVVPLLALAVPRGKVDRSVSGGPDS